QARPVDQLQPGRGQAEAGGCGHDDGSTPRRRTGPSCVTVELPGEELGGQVVAGLQHGGDDVAQGRRSQMGDGDHGRGRGLVCAASRVHPAVVKEPGQPPYPEVARRGSPEPTSQRVSTAPSWGGAGAFTTVSNRKPGPRTARAAAPTSSFWVDAGARGASGARATTWVWPSCTTRHEGSPASTAPACWSSSTPGGGLAGAGAAAARGGCGGAVDVVPG